MSASCIERMPRHGSLANRRRALRQPAANRRAGMQLSNEKSGTTSPYRSGTASKARGCRSAGRLAGLMFAAAALSACGGGDDTAPAAPGPAPAPAPVQTSAAACFDMSPAQGKTVERTYTVTFPGSGIADSITFTETSTVGAQAAATFQGQQATETTTVGTSLDSSGNRNNFTDRIYTQTGASEFTTYGGTSESRSRCRTAIRRARDPSLGFTSPCGRRRAASAVT